MRRLPLEGVRVVDLTWAAAGPYCTFLLALLGAECIKVETASRLGLDRKSIGLMAIPGMTPDVNANKRSLTLNLKHPQGRGLALRLCALSDMVVSNFRPGALERLGLGYEALRGVSPALVMVSISAHGLTGPERDGAGYAGVFAALGGAGYITGYQEGPPVELRLPIDIVCGTVAALAALAALRQARETGRGQLVEVPNREVVSSLLGEYLLDALINGREGERAGNENPVMAPHNVYPCQGKDEWLAIAVSTEQEWQALCQATGHREWLEDPRFADPYGRWHHREELDRALAAWCRGHTKEAAFHLLQRAGVPAGPSLGARDLLKDPHLQERGVFVQAATAEGKPFLMPGAPGVASHLPLQVTRIPGVGEDNAYVLGEVLGLTEGEIGELERKGVVA